jgi:4-hydroxysphinganine ceramide fatty acyl 2-hydroxylase
LNDKINFDYDRGLLWQIFCADFTFDEYVTYINEPKHLVNPIRDIKLFDHWFLEAGSKAPWWGVFVAWVPMMIACIYQMTIHNYFTNPLAIFGELVLGICLWTFIEYFLHRFLFHGEEYWMQFVPLNKYVWTAHFLFHGIHHSFPQDRYRLVMPAVPGYTMGYFLIYLPASMIVPESHIYNLALGIMTGYIIYDEMHYFMHHSNP